MGQLNFFDGEEDENPPDVQQAWDDQSNPSPTPPQMDKRFPDMTKEEADAARARGKDIEQVRPMPTPERDVIPMRSLYHSDTYAKPEELGPTIMERLRRSELVNSLGKMHDLNREYTAPEKLLGKAFYYLGPGRAMEQSWESLKPVLDRFDERQRKRAQAAMTARMDKVFDKAFEQAHQKVLELRNQPGQVHGSEKFSKEQMDELNQGLTMMQPQATARSTPEPKYQSFREGAQEWDDELERRMRRRALEEGWPGEPEPSF